MPVVSAIVLYLVLWFLTLLCVLPIRLESQAERGEIVPGTHAGSPADPQMKKRFIWTTAIATALWVIIVAVILSGAITIQDIDFFDRMPD